LPDTVIAALRAGKDPLDLDQTQQGALVAARCVLASRPIPPDLQETLIGLVGVKGVIELVVLVGFYRMIAGVIFAFDVPLPEGAAAPF
jgi:4-carboxymuconolactone decarboxylase